MPTRALITRYEDDLKLWPDFWHKVAWLFGLLVFAAFPLMGAWWTTIATLGFIHIVGALALMILTGFAGQISLGHAAFLAIGAYTAAVLGNEFELPFWLLIPISGTMAALVGLALGPFALRLRGLYLAIVTIGLLFLVNHTLHTIPQTGGVGGTSVPMYYWFGAEYDVQTLKVGVSFELKLYALFGLMAFFCAMACVNIRRSNIGRAMFAIRDHDLAAAVLGVKPLKTKLMAFGISSFFAGVAGAMFAFQQQYITIEPPFDMNMSVQYIAMIVLGGIGTVFGAVAGALVFTFLTPLAEIIGPFIPLVSELSSAQQSTLIFSLVVCGFLIFEPMGVLGIWLRIKRYFQTWPFSY